MATGRGERRVHIVVPNRDAADAVLAAFSSHEHAQQALRRVIDQYGEGSTLGLHGKPIAPGLKEWREGSAVAPQIRSLVLDWMDGMPGAWAVRVDAGGKMIACEFTFRRRANDTHMMVRTGEHAILEAYGATPRDALTTAQQKMRWYRADAANPTKRGRFG